MGLFNALSKITSSPTFGGITQGLVQDQRRAFAQSQFDEQKQREQAERDFATEFTKKISSGDIGGASQLFDQFGGQLSPQTMNSARSELAKVKTNAQQQQAQGENIGTMSQAMLQGATPTEGQYLADAGRAGSGLDALMAVRGNVQGREQQAQEDAKGKKIDLIKSLANALPAEQRGAFVKANLDDVSVPDIPTGESGMPEQKIDFKNEQDLRKEYQTQSKEFTGVKDAYVRVLSSAKNPSPAGDLALIFNYMKILDPGSVVREGEFANAQNAGSIPERIRATYNKILNGERLSAPQREDFVTRAKELFNGQAQTQKQRQQFYGKLAEAYGFASERAVPDLMGDDVIESFGSDSQEPKFNPETGRYE